MKVTYKDLREHTAAAIETINEALDGVEYIGTGKAIGVCVDSRRIYAEVNASTVDDSATIMIRHDMGTLLIVTVREGEALELSGENKEWHILSLRVEAE